MSRCYPFPPPGYEKKARVDDVDVLKKACFLGLDKTFACFQVGYTLNASYDFLEKHKEKRHKKEKRDKETREGKERREKDRGDGERRDKNDRKEKYRDKKKDKEKEREKDKEKASTSGEKRIAVQNENYDGEKFCQKEKNHNRDKSNISNEKKQASLFQVPDREKPIQNSLLAEDISDSKLVEELDRRIRDEHRGAGSQLVQRFSAVDRKKDEAMDKFLVKEIRTLAEGKDKRNENKKMGGQGIREEAGFSGNAMGQNTIGVVQNRIEEMAKSMEKNTERRMEGKEKSRDKEADEKRGDRQKDKNREKKSQAKDKDGKKERQAEKMKERNENKFLVEDKFKDSNKNNLIATSDIQNSYFTQEQGKGAVADGNPKKRNNLHINGFLHDSEVMPNKLLRQSSHLSTENGRKLEPCQTSVHLTSDRQGAASNLNHKEHKLNGIVEVQPSLSISSLKTSSVIKEADRISEMSKKPPHPDSKYLTQVLSVPKMEEWIDFDDQEWLFSRDVPTSEKPGVGSVGANKTPWVWSEVLQIESADICALPYVVPL